MNYEQTLDFLYASLPMFQRIGAQAYKPSLDNTIALCEAVGNPQHQFKSIHIAGTNGKGSSSHMIASILQSSGYKTGLYTSPHLLDFRERIKLNGEMISKEDVVDFVKKYKIEIDRIQPSFFELCVAMAFHYFAKQKVDIAVIEVGMGGRLDSTNVIHPLVSLITNIGFDHMQFLGDTLPKIAAEKAGIIKKNVPVVISEYQLEVSEVFKEKAIEQETELYFASNDYQLTFLENPRIDLSTFICDSSLMQNKTITCSLPGRYQAKNIAGVLKTIELVKSKGFQIKENHILEGILNVKEQTGLRGRWDVISENPLIIADTGHNEDGIKEILKQLKNYQYNTLHWVWGMVNDKDPEKVFKLLPKEATFYFCKPNIPRGLDAIECRNIAKLHGLEGDAYDSVYKAFEFAKQKAKPDDIILIAGSTFVVAEVL